MNYISLLRGNDISKAMKEEWNNGNDLKSMPVYLKQFFKEREASPFLCLCNCTDKHGI